MEKVLIDPLAFAWAVANCGGSSQSAEEVIRVLGPDEGSHLVKTQTWRSLRTARMEADSRAVRELLDNATRHLAGVLPRRS